MLIQRMGSWAVIISAAVGLITIGIALWKGGKWFVIWCGKVGDGVEAVQTLPGQVKALDLKIETKVTALDTKVEGIRHDMDVRDAAQIEKDSHLHSSLAELKRGHEIFDTRLRAVESGVEVLKDRKERDDDAGKAP